MEEKTLHMPEDEDQRLQALQEYDVIGTGTDKTFDYLTDLLAELLDVPIALITLVA